MTQLELGAQHIQLTERHVVALTRDDTIFEELLLSGLGTLRELDSVQGPLAFGKELGIVDFQEKLTRGNPTPLVEVNGGDLARDLADDIDLLVGAQRAGGREPFGEL
jgi:hypothetical protein